MNKPIPTISLEFELHPRLIETPITRFDIEQILGYLGFSASEIKAATIHCSTNEISIRWTSHERS